MKDIKIQYKDTHKEFQIEVNDIDYKEDIAFLEHILEQFGIHKAEVEQTSAPADKEPLSDVESKMLSLYSSYLGDNKPTGLHNPTSEYTPPTKNSKTESTIQDTKDNTTTSIEEAFRKAKAVKESESPSPLAVSKYEPEQKYQAYYICPNCGNKGKRYVRQNDKILKCHRCPEVMQLRDAHDDGFPQEDRFGNVFIAGTFIKERQQK